MEGRRKAERKLARRLLKIAYDKTESNLHKKDKSPGEEDYYGDYDDDEDDYDNGFVNYDEVTRVTLTLPSN